MSDKICNKMKVSYKLKTKLRNRFILKKMSYTEIYIVP